MAHRYIAQLQDQETLNGVYLVRSRHLRTNRHGDPYLHVELADRTGSISALMWNARPEQFERLQEGGFARVRGKVQMYQGSIQIIAQQISPASPQEVNPQDYFRHSPQSLDQLAQKLAKHLRQMQDPHLQALAECFLMDEALLRQFSQAPAGTKHHHAYPGGLLEHVVQMMDVARAVAACYPELNADQLVMGVFLHDLGKVRELEYQGAWGYSDEGQLLGHIVIGVSILEQKIAEAEKLSGEPFPRELALRLKHLIVSHHGQQEHGSPVIPMTLEAITLTYLDNLDAKLHTFQQMITESQGSSGPWTYYHAALGRRVFRGSGSQGAESE